MEIEDMREDGRRDELRKIWRKLMDLLAMEENKEDSDEFRELYGKLMASYEPICKIYKPEQVWAIISGGDMSKNIDSLEKYGRYAEIRDIYEVLLLTFQSLSLDEKQQENNMTADMKQRLSISYGLLGDFSKARSLLNEILPFYQNVGDYLAAVEVLDSLGMTCSFMGDTKSSKEYYAQALAILENKLPKDSSEIADAAFKLGTAYSLLLDYPETKKYYEYALSIFQKSLPESLFDVAKMFHNIGICLQALSDYQGSKKYYEQALQILEQSFPEDDQTIDALLDFGRFYFSLGNKTKRDECSKKALMILERPRKKYTADRGGRAHSLLTLGEIFKDSEDYVKAEQYLRQALEIFESFPSVRTLSEIFTSLATLYFIWGISKEETKKERLATKFYELAKRCYEDALAILLKFLPDNAPSVTGIYLMIGTTCACLKKYPEAHEYHQIAYGKCISYSKDANMNTVYALFSLGKDYAHMGKRNAALFYMKLAVNMIQASRSKVLSLDKDLQRSYADSNEKYYRALADLLAEERRFAEAQRVMDMLKEEELSAFVRRSEICNHQTTTVPYINKEEELRISHEKIDELYVKKEKLLKEMSTHPSKDDDQYHALETKLDEATKEIGKIDRELDEFIESIENTLKSDESREEFSTMNDKDIKLTQGTLGKMGHGVVLLRLAVAEDGVNLFLTAPNSSLHEKFRIKKSELMRKIFEFRSLIEKQSEDVTPAAKELYDILIAPVSEGLQGAHVLMCFLDEALRYVPIAALHNGKGWIIQTYAVTVKTVYNSFSIENESGTNAKIWNNVAAMGVTDVPDDFSPISWVEKELKSIVAPDDGENENGLPGIIRLNDAFSEFNLKLALEEGFSIVHIATHYIFILKSPAKSFLLLGNGYVLTLDNIRYLGSNFSKVKLVTLSCCETALNLDKGGKDVEGLGEVILQRGARAVIATLWKIEDRSTADFMPRFYEILRAGEITKAEALQRTQCEFIESKKYAHPYHWAPFVLMGDWS